MVPRKGEFRVQIAKSELEELYKFHSTAEIAKMFGCGDESVRLLMKHYDIQRRSVGGRREFNPPKEELEQLYQQYDMRQIARMLGVGQTVVWKRLQEHGIKLRGYEDGGHTKKPGRQFSAEHKANIKKARRANRMAGEQNPNWKGGLTAVNLRARTSVEYKDWREAALSLRGSVCQKCGVNDGYACECCGTRVKLHVHHLYSFSKYPDLRYDPKNSEVLCPKCHHSEHRGKRREVLEPPESLDTTAEPVTADVTV